MQKAKGQGSKLACLPVDNVVGAKEFKADAEHEASSQR